jgi:hypothetical protein
MIQIGYEAFRAYYSEGREIERQKCEKRKQQRSNTCPDNTDKQYK